MSDMTDYEINKRLAEIAGVSLYAKSDESGLCRIREKSRRTLLWSPLTDWSQLGPLMKAQDISVWSLSAGGPWTAECPYRKHGMMECASANSEISMERAICLAIIAAHGE
jgi:hypothetical protein